jgi:hypothetical protein
MKDEYNIDAWVSLAYLCPTLDESVETTDEAAEIGTFKFSS